MAVAHAERLPAHDNLDLAAKAAAGMCPDFLVHRSFLVLALRMISFFQRGEGRTATDGACE
jgi:hypothetical protein